jgi:hypothetical protein
MADALSKLIFEEHLAEAKAADDAGRWKIECPADLEVRVTLSPTEHHEAFVARLVWIEYPGCEPPSVKFIDPATGRLDVPQAWPVARGFRPTNFDICATWTREGFQIHPEWKNDRRYIWISHGNLVLKSLHRLQEELDDSYQGRFKS